MRPPTSWPWQSGGRWPANVSSTLDWPPPRSARESAHCPSASARCWSLARMARVSRRSQRHSSSQREPCATTCRRRFRSWRSTIAPRRRRSPRTRDGCNHQERRAEMIVVTTEEVTGHRIVEMKGQVFGLVVRSRGLGGNIVATLRSIGGGEIVEYTELLEDARRHAIDRMVQNATPMGANAVVRMQYDSSEIGSTMSEIVAYGTAAVVEPLKS